MKKLEMNEMVKIDGGVSLAEYCTTLNMILNNNDETVAMLAAWGTHCAAFPRYE